MERVRFIVLHHTAIRIAEPESIHKWHLDNGWAGFGYNEYIRKNGDVVIGRGFSVGAQCKNYNSSSYGIALEGDFRVEKPTKEQILTLKQRVEYLKTFFPAFEGLKNHYDLVKTDCPNLNLVDFLNYSDYNFEFLLLGFQKLGIINSPQYWLDNAKVGKTCRGDYVKTLIERLAKRL
jgi:hypothetical protein